MKQEIITKKKKMLDGIFCFALILIGIAAYAITVWLFPFDDEK